MSDDIKNKDNIKSDINSDDESQNTSNEVNLQSEGEKSVSHEVIHKKDGRLHIYVRQDKYKGELKSKNWVGRAYIAGKQTIHSSRTTVLEEAIPILEKWFDEISEKRDEAQNKTENLEKNSSETISKTEIQEKQLPLEKDENKGLKSGMFEKLKDIKVGNLLKSKKSSEENSDENKNSPSSMMDKLKNIKLDGLLKKNTNEGAEGEKKSFDSIKKLFKPGGDNKGKKNSLDSIKNLFKSKVSKVSVAGEEIAGIDITREAIRVSQVSGDKDNGFVLDKFSYRSLDQEKVQENILESRDYLVGEIEQALINAKITTQNVAISIPVSSAIIRVVQSPLITETELQKAIETDSLWENLVQLGENLNEYSIFHQVINRNEKAQTMEILFVASKLSDINDYSSLMKKCGLNPVIVDVRCFTLKNSFDNSIFKNIEERKDSTILEVGTDENYLMIIHNDTPIITDIFLRQQEKELLTSLSQTSESNAEAQAVIRRYAMQLKQALNDYEGKYDSKINNIQVISSLENIDNLIPEFKKNLPTVGFKLFDPLENVSVPQYNSDKVDLKNKSPLASVMGLAFRKLDIFGYYKFVTAVKNINLLPNREALKKTAKLKFLSGFAFKGAASAIAAIYIVMSVFSYFQIQSNKSKLVNFDEIQMEYETLQSEHTTISNKLYGMMASLELGKVVGSNQINSYRALAQVARSVPARVQFTKMVFDGENSIKIEGKAFSDQDILNFINNLNAKKLVKQASLVTMNVQTSIEEGDSSTNKKGFEIACIIES
jgi:type IV pilus assembly protein PilN